MADQEPESQILPSDSDYHSEILSPPPILGSMPSQNAGNGLSRSYAEVEESLSQQDDFQPESYTSHIKETQFVSVEPDTQLPDSYASHVEETQFMAVEEDTQTVDDINLSANHLKSQVTEAAVPNASLNAASLPASLISRPDVGDIDDIAEGFTFSQFEKPAKGKFNRPLPPVAAKPQRITENRSEKDISKGPTAPRAPITAQQDEPSRPASIHAPLLVNTMMGSNIRTRLDVLPPSTAGIVQPDASSHPTSLHQSSLGNSTAGSNIKQGLHVDENCAQVSPHHETLPAPLTARDPQTPVSEASAERPAQKSSNKSHKRVKKQFGMPFPEEADSQSNQRQRGNRRITNVPQMKSPLTHAKQRPESASAAVHANPGHSRLVSPSIYEGSNDALHRHRSAPFLEPSLRHSPRVLDRPTPPTATTQRPLPAKSTGRASAPLNHTDQVWNADEQLPSDTAIRLAESAASESQPSKIVRQHNGPLQVTEAIHSHSDQTREPIIPEETIEQPELGNLDLQEQVSKLDSEEIQPNVQELTHAASSQAGDTSEIGTQYGVSIPNHGPSRVQSEVPSRPQSRRSNCGKPMTRPVPTQELRPQGVLESVAQRETHSSKVTKSNNALNNLNSSEASTRPAISEHGGPKSRPSPKLFEEYKKFLQNGQEMLDIMKDYEQQSQLVEAQKTEIEKLRDTSASTIKQVQALEKERTELADKLKKFAELSSKYKKHMNDVVKAQKYLKSQAMEIQTRTQAAIESTKIAAETHAAQEAALKQVQKVKKNAKDLRVPAEKSDKVLAQNRVLEAANQKLHEETQSLRDETKKLRDDNERLAMDNNTLKINYAAATKNYELLHDILQKRLVELAHEKHQVQQLQESLGDPQDSNKTLLELLQKTPKDVSDELSKEGGLLAKILDLERAIQAIVNEAAIIGSSFKNQEAKPSPSLIKLIEDLFSRFETSMQASTAGAAARRESNLKLLDNLKTTVNQLRLDKETERQLNNRIFELGKSNDTLVAEKNSREREVQGLAYQIDELKRDLADCHSQLSSKTDELASALAAPKEDPRLKAQIQDLESANDTVRGQLEGSSQELAKLRGELSSHQELSRRKDQQIKNWEQKLNEAQSRINTLNEEKTKFIANKQQEIETACQAERQRIAKAAETSKATMKMKLESEVSLLERKVKERDAELALAKEDLQKAQDGSFAQDNKANKLQQELVIYKGKLGQQLAHLKRLEEQNPGREASDRLADTLQSVRNECTELRNHLESIRNENIQNVKAALKGQQAIERNLRQLDALENENEQLKQKNVELQTRVKSLNQAYTQQKGLHAGQRGSQRAIGGAKNTAFVTPQAMLRLSQQTQDFRPSSEHTDSLDFGSILRNARVSNANTLDTPEDALRKAAKGIGSHNLRSGSQGGTTVQTSSSSVNLANNFQTPQIRNQGVLNERSTNFNTPNTDVQRIGSGGRPLKVAARKHGAFSHSGGTGAGPHEPNPTETPTQVDSTNAVDVQGSSEITLFATFASNAPTPSPFTDLSSMIDRLGSTPNQEQLQEAYTKARGKKDGSADGNGAGLRGLQAFAQETVNSRGERDGERDFIRKSQARVRSLLTTEEAIRRRTALPPKSAIKKPKLANDATHISEPRPLAITEPPKDSTRVGNKAASQIQNGSRGSYNRAVSGGKPQTPKAKNQSTVSEHTQGTSNGEEYSPNMPIPKRNNLKRVGSATSQTQAVPKRVRTSRGSSMASRGEVPDSQDTQNL